MGKKSTVEEMIMKQLQDPNIRVSEPVGSLEAVMAVSSILNVENKVLKYVYACMCVWGGLRVCKEFISF